MRKADRGGLSADRVPFRRTQPSAAHTAVRAGCQSFRALTRICCALGWALHQFDAASAIRRHDHAEHAARIHAALFRTRPGR